MTTYEYQWKGFEWDEGNLLKNWEKHGVTPSECEQLFFNRPLVTGHDGAHPREESRWYALGVTDAARPLYLVFTVRIDLIRVISARTMSQKERKIFES